MNKSIFNGNKLLLLTPKFRKTHKTFSFSQFITIVQFVIIVFLVSSIIGINKQVSFLKNMNKGMDIFNKFVIKTPANLQRDNNGHISNIDAFESELSKIAGVQNVAISNNIPGDIPTFNFNISEQTNDKGVKTALFIADNNFLESYKIRITEGSSFNPENHKGCIVNNICMRQLGYEKAKNIIGKKVTLNDKG